MVSRQNAKGVRVNVGKAVSVLVLSFILMFLDLQIHDTSSDDRQAFEDGVLRASRFIEVCMSRVQLCVLSRICELWRSNIKYKIAGSPFVREGRSTSAENCVLL